MFRHSCTREQHFNVVRLWLILWACIHNTSPIPSRQTTDYPPLLFFCCVIKTEEFFPRLHVLVCGGRSGDASEQKGKNAATPEHEELKFLCFLFDTLARTSQFFFVGLESTHISFSREKQIGNKLLFSFGRRGEIVHLFPLKGDFINSQPLLPPFPYLAAMSVAI